MPKVTINGKEVEVEPGTTIMLAAQKLGINIPHYCWHPDLSIAGNCRMCLVHVEKMPKLVTACSTPVADGMVVTTDSPQVKEGVRGVLELMLVNHPIDCPVCDQAGECGLQDYYMTYGLHDSHVSLEEKVRKRKVIDLGPMVVLDTERCILCSRCIRFQEEVSGARELQFFGRGDHVEIGTFQDRPLTDPYSGNVVDICPVGALTSKDFRFKMRVWFLKSNDSICPGCSTGCNLRVDHRNGIIYRLIPRRNVDVNASWLCDEGRMSFKSLGRGKRLVKTMVRQNGKGLVEVNRKDAYLEVVRNLENISNQRGPNSIAAIASAMATNETLYLFKRFMQEVVGSSLIDFRTDDSYKLVREREDKVLRRLDKHPNSQGALDLGLVSEELGGLAGAIEAAKAGKIRALVMLFIPQMVREESAQVYQAISELLTLVEFSAVLTTHEIEAFAGADVLLPVAAWSEEDGTYTNYDRRVQLLNRAILPPGDARAGWEVFATLARISGKDLGFEHAGDVFARLAAETPGYNGLTHAAVGKLGVKLQQKAIGGS